MNMKRRVRVTIDPFGNPTIETEGFVGDSCAQATKKLEDLLSSTGMQNERYLKPEWHETDAQKETNTQEW